MIGVDVGQGKGTGVFIVNLIKMESPQAIVLIALLDVDPLSFQSGLHHAGIEKAVGIAFQFIVKHLL